MHRLRLSTIVLRGVAAPLTVVARRFEGTTSAPSGDKENSLMKQIAAAKLRLREWKAQRAEKRRLRAQAAVKKRAELRQKQKEKHARLVARLKAKREKRRQMFARRKEHHAKMVERRAKLRKVRRERLLARRVKMLERRAKLRQVMKQRKLAQKERQQVLSEKKADRATRQKLIEQPWKAQGKKLTTSPMRLFLSERYHAVAQKGDKPMEVMAKLRAEFKALSAEERAPYEERAKANKEARVAAKKKIKGMRAMAYGLFLKDTFKEVTAGIPGKDGVGKMPLVAKEIARRWKELPEAERLVYKERAAALRAEGKKNFEALRAEAEKATN